MLTPMRRSSWGWEERLSIAVVVVLFLAFLRPMFGISHPLGYENLTARLISAVIMSAMSSSFAGGILYIVLKA